MEKSKYKRIIIKISGEALSGKGGSGLDKQSLLWLVDEIKELVKLKIEIGIVIGGGNIIRGSVLSQSGIDRITADYAGMLATVINALILQDLLEKENINTRVHSSINMVGLVEPYVRRRANQQLSNSFVIIFAAGTGNPFFTTDTAASLRAVELNADVIIKGTKVDGVYSSDPEKDKNAKKYEKLTYLQVLEKRLKVMDSTAISLCMDNNIPILILNLFKKGNIKKAILGQKIGTIIN